MTPLKCVHLNSVTRFILITILVSIFSQSFDCKPTNSVTILTSEQGNISQPIDNGTRPQIHYNYTTECTSGTCITTPVIANDKPSINNDTNSQDRERAVHPPDEALYTKNGNPIASNSSIVESIKAEVRGSLSSPTTNSTLIHPDTSNPSDQKNQTVSASSLGISESETVNENNNFTLSYFVVLGPD
uniref:Uncharacterized protein n=1 Tax=Tetranychus urticae TaxID=32264 RepID=T1KJU0_TETUR